MTPDRDREAAGLEAAALELAPGKHVPVFLPSAGRVTAGGRGASAPAFAGLAGSGLGQQVALERATVRVGTVGGSGSGRRHMVPSCLVRRQG